MPLTKPEKECKDVTKMTAFTDNVSRTNTLLFLTAAVSLNSRAQMRQIFTCKLLWLGHILVHPVKVTVLHYYSKQNPFKWIRMTEFSFSIVCLGPLRHNRYSQSAKQIWELSRGTLWQKVKLLQQRTESSRSSDPLQEHLATAGSIRNAANGWFLLEGLQSFYMDK